MTIACEPAGWKCSHFIEIVYKQMVYNAYIAFDDLNYKRIYNSIFVQREQLFIHRHWHKAFTKHILFETVILPFTRILHFNPTRNLCKSFSKRSRCQADFLFICVVYYYLKSAQFFGKDTKRFWRGFYLSFGFESCISKHVFQNFEQTKVQTNVIKNRSM